ncbi:MAG: hypothetical protein BEN18_08345 [Epulopiscium sp. Nuni2H_MBin001]|nr:MAG: hypothetical protein BEN18_08345 [Epulopiscium sp. Nuni2H_MBin001]
MTAEQTAFNFIRKSIFLDIPFFQRPYVWEKDDWDSLLDTLVDGLDNKSSIFLGSIILKEQPSEDTGVKSYQVIDGQQRLTTLSILVKACYDSDEELQSDQDARVNLAQILFTKLGSKKKKLIKINHSRVDVEDYENIVHGNFTSIKDKSTNLCRCYTYFKNELSAKDSSTREAIWDILVMNETNLLVKIELGENDNEQAIFDSINSAGVRLTCFDTIKNTLFQRAYQLAQTEEDKEEILNVYDYHWAKVFENPDDLEGIKFWQQSKSSGRLERDNKELLLNAVASINGFYNPNTHKMVELTNKYKVYMNGITQLTVLLDFIKEIADYAIVYRKKFTGFNKATLHSYKDDEKRLLQILEELGVYTFHAYLLKLFKEQPDNLVAELKLIEKFVLRHYLCGVSAKNFNKETAVVFKDGGTMAKLWESKESYINDKQVKASLKSLHRTQNKVPTLILFWIELKRRSEDSKTDITALAYTYSLEHIMPKKWEDHWGTDNPPVMNDGRRVTNQEEAKEIRDAAVYQIGNATLLKKSLNSKIKNDEFTKKMKGSSSRSKGIKEYGELFVTKEVIDIYDKGRPWDEDEINLRTERLTEEFFKIW